MEISSKSLNHKAASTVDTSVRRISSFKGNEQHEVLCMKVCYFLASK